MDVGLGGGADGHNVSENSDPCPWGVSASSACIATRHARQRCRLHHVIPDVRLSSYMSLLQALIFVLSVRVVHCCPRNVGRVDTCAPVRFGRALLAAFSSMWQATNSLPFLHLRTPVRRCVCDRPGLNTPTTRSQYNSGLHLRVCQHGWTRMTSCNSRCSASL